MIYVRYVSDDSEWGADFGNWPANFTEFVEVWLAYKVAPRLTGISKGKKELKDELNAARTAAKGTDAMEQPAKQAPPTSWLRSRWGRSGGDRGNRSSLIG